MSGQTRKNSERLRQLNDEAIERLVVADRKTAVCLGRPLNPVALSPASRQGNAKWYGNDWMLGERGHRRL